MNATITSTFVWQSLAWPSTVIHQHIVSDTEIRGRGLTVGKTDQGTPFAYLYHVALTPAWEMKTVSVTSLLDRRTLALRHDAGRWRDSACAHLRGFDGVSLVDLSISPFTNTIAIKQLSFVGDEPRTTDVVFFDENHFAFRRVQQRYRQIARNQYRYHDVESADFAADIVVDDAGLVIDYEGLFKRV